MFKRLKDTHPACGRSWRVTFADEAVFKGQAAMSPPFRNHPCPFCKRRTHTVVISEEQAATEGSARESRGAL